jgi:hypothetical protein
MAEVAPRPLAEDDGRNHFDCGRESLNAWFRRHVCDTGVVMMATDPTREHPLADAGCRGVGSVREHGR